MKRFLATDGVSIAYTIDDYTDPWREGAPTAILLHAGMGSSKRWIPMVPSLARRFRVVRMDLRGHGESAVPPPGSPLTLERMTADVRDLMAHLGVPQAHFICNATGGYLGHMWELYAMWTWIGVLATASFTASGMSNAPMAGAIAARGSLLRPHVKTHKMPEVVRLALAEGIRRFKAATIAEAEMAAAAGAGAGREGPPPGMEGVPDDLLKVWGVSKVMTVTSTYDHRVIQGAESGAFLRDIAGLLAGAEGFYDEIRAALALPAQAPLVFEASAEAPTAAPALEAIRARVAGR